MNDIFKNFRETISERIRSPFVGSFIICWILAHWEIVLFLIYSEDNLTIDGRIGKISEYIQHQNFLTLVLYPVLVTFGVLIGYSILAQAITNSSIGLSDKKPFTKRHVSTFDHTPFLFYCMVFFRRS